MSIYLETSAAAKLLVEEAESAAGKHLRSLDALHVAVAVRVAAEEMATYDVRRAEAARSVGLRVVAPDGAGSTNRLG